MSRRWRGARPTRPRRWEPPWPQAVPSTAIPAPIRQTSTRRAAAPRRTVFATVPPSPPRTACPAFVGRRPARPPTPRRGQFTAVPPPATAPIPAPLGHRRPPTPPVRPGRFQPVITPPVQPPTWIPPRTTRRAPAIRQTRRGATWTTPGAPATTAATNIPRALAPARHPRACPPRRWAPATPPPAPALPAVDLLVTRTVLRAGWWTAALRPGWWTAQLGAGGSMPQQSVDSLQYVPVTVTTALGDPTGYPVQMAFTVPSSAGPETWADAEWVEDPPIPLADGTYVAQCLVGPGAPTVLTQGLYRTWVRIVANPETLVLLAGTLVIA